MDFVLGSLALVAVVVGIIVLVSQAYPGSGADLLDWKPTRSPETEIELEMNDVQQMIEAQNEYRRRRGAPEIDEGDAQRMAAEDEAVRDRTRPSSSGPDAG